MWLVGDLWERGEISVADEHLATEITVRVLALQREAERVAVARAANRVMLATPEGEQHVVALRMTRNLLREAGYDVLMLGAEVPPRDLAAAAARYEPDVICLSATMPGATDRVLVAIDEVQETRPGAAFVVGGPRPGTAHALGAGHQRLPARPGGGRGGRRDDQAGGPELARGVRMFTPLGSGLRIRGAGG